MDKSWVWLPRISLEYEQGATTFVYASAKNLGNPAEMFCPCIDCRNMSHQPIDEVLEHLVIRGMDERYKRNSCWSRHGDIRNAKTNDDLSCGLAGKKNQSEEGSKSEASDVRKGVRCLLLNWYSQDDAVVAEGELCSVEPMYKIGRIPLGPHAAAVVVKSVSNKAAYVWRPTPTVISLGQAVRVEIPWPPDKIILDNEMDSPTENKNADSSATDASLEKIHIFDWILGDSVIAEGRLCSTDPKELVDNIPLGPNSAIVKVEMVFNKEAYLWRPSVEMSIMADALHENIAWPIRNIQLVNLSPREESTHKRPSSRSSSNSTGSSSKSVKKSCRRQSLFN